MNGYVAAMENELHRPSEIPANITWFETIAFGPKG
jgi:hypothetical protein